MKNLSIVLDNCPGALAEMGEVLGRAGISIEGGGVFVVNGVGVANFLFEDGAAASEALTTAGIRVDQERDVVVQRLDQGQAGQLGKLLRRMADAGVNVEVQYSDHNHQVVLVVDDIETALSVSKAWTRESGETQRAQVRHHYETRVCWTGSEGVGTRSYTSYSRNFQITGTGKTPIQCSSDPAFRGNAKRYNPEELLVASLSSCHMLWYLHLCAVNGVIVLAYEDAASGVMEVVSSGSGNFIQVNLNPSITIAAGSDRARAEELHSQAHQSCFIANSVNFPVHIVPTISYAEK